MKNICVIHIHKFSRNITGSSLQRDVNLLFSDRQTPCFTTFGVTFQYNIVFTAKRPYHRHNASVNIGSMPSWSSFIKMSK